MFCYNLYKISQNVNQDCWILLGIRTRMSFFIFYENDSYNIMIHELLCGVNLSQLAFSCAPWKVKLCLKFQSLGIVVNSNIGSSCTGFFCNGFLIFLSWNLFQLSCFCMKICVDHLRVDENDYTPKSHLVIPMNKAGVFCNRTIIF